MESGNWYSVLALALQAHDPSKSPPSGDPLPLGGYGVGFSLRNTVTKK